MPKDFVFVDLSPVKTDSDVSCDDMNSPLSASESQISTPNNTFDEMLFSECQLQLSISSMESEEDLFSNFDYSKVSNLLGFNDLYDSGNLQSAANDLALGLGISGIDWNAHGLQAQNSNNIPMDTYGTDEFTLAINQIYPNHQEHTTQNNIYETNFLPNNETKPHIANNHKRSKSCPEVIRKKSSQGIQFKTYKGPNISKKKRIIKHKRSNSESSILTTPKSNINTPTVESLNNILNFGKEFESNLNLNDSNEPLLTYSPVSEYSDFEYNTLGKALKGEQAGCESSQFMNKIDNFDFNLFV